MVRRLVPFVAVALTATLIALAGASSAGAYTFVRAWSSHNPQGVAVNSALNDVYVSDRAGNKIH